MAIRAICRPGHDCDRFEGTRTRPSARVAVPREEWIEVPVPALVDEAVFEAAQAQMAENRQRKRDGLRGPRWLLQGLTVCHRCGYAFYGKTVPRSSKDRTKGDYRLYRCIGCNCGNCNPHPQASRQSTCRTSSNASFQTYRHTKLCRAWLSRIFPDQDQLFRTPEAGRLPLLES